MSATTKTYRDGNGATFTAREWDDGAASSGMPVLGDGAGAELAKAEDAPAVSGDKGLVVLGVRRDSAASSSGTDGDYSTFNFDATGNLYTTGNFSGSVTITAGATSIAKAEDVASANADVGVPAMAIQKATPADTAGTDGDYAMVQMSAGRLWTSAVVTAAAASIGKAEDVASSDADVGVPAMAVRKATPANTSGTDGDYEMLQMANGLLWTDAQSHGDVAHDGADGGNPVKIGARARSSEIAAVSNNDRSDLLTDLVGKLIVLPYANPENFVSGAITSAMTGTTSTSLIAAPASGLRNYITQITVSNSHATVGTDVIIQDGSGGTTLYTIPAAAVYGGAVITFPTPLRQPTTATAIYCANVTTGASTKVSASGYKGA
jgi:hypothetical protein